MRKTWLLEIMGSRNYYVPPRITLEKYNYNLDSLSKAQCVFSEWQIEPFENWVGLNLVWWSKINCLVLK